MNQANMSISITDKTGLDYVVLLWRDSIIKTIIPFQMKVRLYISPKWSGNVRACMCFVCGHEC